jgi:transcriptional regulator with XRE-family HTH domain
MAVNSGKTQLRAAIADRGLTLTDVANACGVTRGAVGQWFIDGPNERPIPRRHMATIRELLAEPSSPAKASGSEPQLVMLQPRGFATEPLAVAPVTLPEPARRRRRPPPRVPVPGPMHWGAPPFVGQMPPPGSPIHYPGHWAPPPVKPPPASAYVSPAAGPAAGPQHTVIAAAHNRASQLGEHSDVRSPERGGGFPLGQFFGLTGPIRREDREAFEARLTLEASESGFAGSPELRQMIEALRAAVRGHNRKFGYHETF